MLAQIGGGGGSGAHTGNGGGVGGSGEWRAPWEAVREARAARAATRRAARGGGDGGDGGDNGGGGDGDGGGGIDGSGGPLGVSVCVAPPWSVANACTRKEGARMSSRSRTLGPTSSLTAPPGAILEGASRRAANEHAGPTRGHATRSACWASSASPPYGGTARDCLHRAARNQAWPAQRRLALISCTCQQKVSPSPRAPPIRNTAALQGASLQPAAGEENYRSSARMTNSEDVAAFLVSTELTLHARDDRLAVSLHAAPSQPTCTA